MTALTLLLLVGAYLLGSLSSAVLVCRAFGLPDPRRHGSNNPGATNVFRLGGRLPAVLVLICDILKGTIPVWGSYFLGIEPLFLGLIAVAACLGHIFPLFFGFRGGKAVATAFGAMLPIGLSLAGLLISCWIVVVFVSGYSSLAAIIAVGFAPLFTFWIKPAYTLPVAMLSVLIIARHRANIVRLWRGEEGRIWDKGRTNE
ncbi:glycerol-3-phosphate 1-O-acyltransferase PlsY [Aestuariibacter halophilus]|uniref:Glycerol-3-phosphate acyltransferase n=1 Tax=Fluctibacter halophilus TaxID=226011 RepID=A0ABS8G8D4_9ALTE|nr:glycerol-3-phosphate 1-O-acyltransferase PlsY [Aestuariibacter halophilus]MCC2616421.1 glycerol-3-phosphate 1-O-acyltransferase PlsY [Aestuariibacter halophilus]